MYHGVHVNYLLVVNPVYNTLSGDSVAKADSFFCESCGVVQITEVVNILDLASLGKLICTRECQGFQLRVWPCRHRAPLNLALDKNAVMTTATWNV